jgi:hypothetical protein
VKAKKNRHGPVLPIGQTARVACEIEAMRADCCKAALILSNPATLDETELEECARLDDALAEAQKLLKSAVARLILSRLKRRSRSFLP